MSSDASLELYNPQPGTIHVVDMARDESLYSRRLSDHAFGMLWYGNIDSAITQTDVCEFRATFKPHLVIRAGRTHDGRPLLGPDGLVVVIRGEAYNGGDATLPVSPLTGAQIISHPAYSTWLTNLLYAGGTRTGSTYHSSIGSLGRMHRRNFSNPSPAAGSGSSLGSPAVDSTVVSSAIADNVDQPASPAATVFEVETPPRGASLDAAPFPYTTTLAARTDRIIRRLK